MVQGFLKQTQRRGRVGDNALSKLIRKKQFKGKSASTWKSTVKSPPTEQFSEWGYLVIGKRNAGLIPLRAHWGCPGSQACLLFPCSPFRDLVPPPPLRTLPDTPQKPDYVWIYVNFYFKYEIFIVGLPTLALSDIIMEGRKHENIKGKQKVSFSCIWRCCCEIKFFRGWLCSKSDGVSLFT